MNPWIQHNPKCTLNNEDQSTNYGNITHSPGQEPLKIQTRIRHQPHGQTVTELGGIPKDNAGTSWVADTCINDGFGFENPIQFNPYCLVDPDSCQNAYDNDMDLNLTNATYFERDSLCPPSTTRRETYLSLAILVTICFNCPIGLIAVMTSLSADRSFKHKNIKKGEMLANIALALSMFGLIVAITVTSIVVFYLGSKK